MSSRLSRLLLPKEISAFEHSYLARMNRIGFWSFTIAYVHLFRRGDSGGTPGMLATFEHTLPEL